MLDLLWRRLRVQSLNKTFLSLVRLGIGHRAEALSGLVNWNEVQALAERQGLAAVLVDGIEQLPDSLRPPKELLLQWIGECLQSYEYRYELYRRAIADLAKFYGEHGIKMMVLKGFACSLDWPKPEHRPCGDIDIWQFGEQKEADLILSKETGLNIDDSHEHHTIFDWQGFTVENHYDFIDVHHRKSSPELEKIFKELGSDDSVFKDVNDEKVYLPSPNLHALFLLRHMMEHFASTELTLRQLLDWAFFVKKHGKDVDWKWLERILDEFGMTPAYNIFNAICVEDIGFDALSFPKREVDTALKERVLHEILQPEFAEIQPSGLIPRIVFKFRRWKANGWKNELCFKESMWSAFWSGVWGHILKPNQI